MDSFKLSNSQIAELFDLLQPICKAIYLGGSSVDQIISTPHDYDLICFIDANSIQDLRHQKAILVNRIKQFKHKYDLPIVTSSWYLVTMPNSANTIDMIQVRNLHPIAGLDDEVINLKSYWSYLDKKMIKLVGQDVNLDFDIIDKDRAEYINILKATVNKIIANDKRVKPKRWYHIYIGLCIMENRSYELTVEQVKNANILHDMQAETLKKRLELQQSIIKKLETFR